MSTTTQTTTAAPAAVQLKAASTDVLNFGKGATVYKTPTFTDKYAERQWAKEQVAGAFRVFEKLGFADGGAGHISLRGRWIRFEMSNIYADIQ
jgi:hypothetical protein